MTRRALRVEIMKNLYIVDFYEESYRDFVSFSTDESKDILDKIIECLDEIDQKIEDCLENYSLNRLSMVDKAILRLATYELMYSELKSDIIINEAIEITKEYSNLDDEKQHKFNNKVLDKISKQRN